MYIKLRGYYSNFRKMILSKLYSIFIFFLVMPDLRRLRKDMAELEDIPNTKLEYIDEDDLTKFYIYVKVNDGLYRNHYYKFFVRIVDDWPISAPEFRIQEPIWHPNIEEYNPNIPDSGKICVAPITFNYTGSILLSALVEALKFLLHDCNFNPSNARNPVAADELLKDENMFYAKARELVDKVKENDPSSDDDED